MNDDILLTEGGAALALWMDGVEDLDDFVAAHPPVGDELGKMKHCQSVCMWLVPKYVPQ